MLWIDHVVLAVRDLDKAAARLLEEFGLASVPGGIHPAWGTGNRIVPLGGSYVELLAVVDAPRAAEAAFGTLIGDLTASGDRFFALCLGTDDLDTVAERLGVAVTDGSRLLPDGRTLRWRSAGLDLTMEDRSLPFFIDWQVPEDLHPGRAVAPHRISPTGISWVEMAGEQAVVRSWLGDDEVPLRFGAGPNGPTAVGISTAGGGDVVLR
jgi:hypothetical protein